jgi:Amt family ammonium transporter
MGSIVLGLAAGALCFVFCSTVKNAFGYDDSLDVFGIHAIGGIIGALGTAILASPGLGGYPLGDPDAYSVGAQFWIQFKSVLVTIAWAGVISGVLFLLVRAFLGFRPTPEAEREGLDYTSHGEVAYHS